MDEMEKEKITQDYESVLNAGGYAKLPKATFKITGNPRKLLNGITCNTLDAPTNAFLDRFGKIIVLFKQKIMNDEAYLVVEKQYEERLPAYLKRYLPLTKSKIEKTSLQAFHIIGKGKYEAVLEKGCITIPQRIGFLLLAEEGPGLPEIPGEVYVALRIENEISVQGTDFDDEFILNTNWKEIASLTKGCYVGQEIVASVANKGKPMKKMVRIACEKGDENVIVDGKEVGKITSPCFSPRYEKCVGFAIVPSEIKKADNGKLID